MMNPTGSPTAASQCKIPMRVWRRSRVKRMQDSYDGVGAGAVASSDTRFL